MALLRLRAISRTGRGVLRLSFLRVEHPTKRQNFHHHALAAIALNGWLAISAYCHFHMLAPKTSHAKIVSAIAFSIINMVISPIVFRHIFSGLPMRVQFIIAP